MWWPVILLVLLWSPHSRAVTKVDTTFQTTIPPERCTDARLPESKYFYYGDEVLTLKILTSSRTTHKIVSTILSVFCEEVLGYTNVTLVELDDPSQGFEPDTQFSYISSCTENDCANLDKLIQGPLPVPKAMINLETWLPSNFQVFEWKVKDVGPLGPGGSFGWYMPEKFASQSPPIKDHWRAFTSEKVAEMFSPSDQDMNFIKQRLKKSDGSFVCQDERLCRGTGMYVSPKCHRARHHPPNKNCALMITDFPVRSSFYTTSLVVQQIEELDMYVNVAFVGDKLAETVDYLETQSATITSGERSYLLFHYSPSKLTHAYNFTTVKFETCDQRWTAPVFLTNTSMSPNCLYNFNRFAKVIWPKLKEGAKPVYEALKRIHFTPEAYDHLLTVFEEKMSNRLLEGHSQALADKLALRDVACTWLNEAPGGSISYRVTTKNWERWTDIGVTKKKLKIGGIFPLMGDKYVAPELLPVVDLALHHVNANNSILDKYELDLVVVDGQCTADVVMKRFIDIITNWDYKSFVGILGPACSDTVEPIAGVSKHFRTVVITYSAEGSISTDGKESNYPYFFRTIAENKQYKYAYLRVLEKLQWSQVASLTQDGHRYSEYISHLQDLLQEHSINFIMNRKFQSQAPDMGVYLKDLQERGARIIIGEFFEHAARHVMCEAYKLGMTQQQGYVWFLPAWYQYDWYDLDALREEAANSSNETGFYGSSSITRTSLPNCTTAQMIEALQGHLSLIHANYANDDAKMQTGDTVGKWREMLKDRLDKRNEFDSSRPNKYSGYVYDAVWLYALALDGLIKQNKSYIQDIHSERSVNKLVDIIRATDFQGVSGRINFARGHSRLSNIKIVQWYANATHVIGVYQPNYSLNEKSVDEPGAEPGDLIEWNSHLLRWQTGDASKPNDRSKKCTILSTFAEALNLECEHAISLAFVIGFGSLFCILLLIFIIVKRRYEARMKQTEERMRALGLLTPSCVLTLDEWEIPRDRVVINRKLGEGAFGTVYGGEAFFDEKGWVAVAVKTLKTGSSVEEKLDFLGEADMMKRFDHKNIVKLLGVCTRNEPVYTVMEFMLYGDLKTYLLARRHLVNERNREELDEVSNRRLTSMALDVSRGLSYLAELKYVHRDVACRNCLVNSSRVVKLADFGMTRPMYENDYYRFSRKGMLPVRWMAPESLADGLFTPMSDVWSYGVLLYEMITFGSFPFQGLSNNQVMEHVKAGHTLSIPSGIKPQLENLLKSCWHMTATKRPTASELVELLSNNPRLISPCIDVPLASVQVERTDSLELIPSVRKPSGSVSLTNRPVLTYKRSQHGHDSGVLTANDNSFGSNVSGPYSPMTGYPCGLLNGSPSHHQLRLGDVREPLLSSSQRDRMTPPPTAVRPSASHSSYVPPGYIMLDHTGNKMGNGSTSSPSQQNSLVVSPVPTDSNHTNNRDYVNSSATSV